MPDVSTGALALGAISNIAGGGAKSDAANEAASISRAAENTSTGVDKYMFDLSKSLMSPYVSGGAGSLAGMVDANGQVNPNSPEAQALIASRIGGMKDGSTATGGLRGGNYEDAASIYTPIWLKALTDQRYNRLGGLAGSGVKGALGVGEDAVNVSGRQANSVNRTDLTNLSDQQVQDQISRNNTNLIPQVLGQYYAMQNPTVEYKNGQLVTKKTV